MDPVINLRNNTESPEVPIRKINNSPKKEIKLDDLSWDPQEKEVKTSNKRILLVAAFILASAVFLFIKLDEYMFSIFLFLCSVLIIILNNKKMGIKKVNLGIGGLTINNDHYNYKDLKSFWINYQPSGLKELIIEPKTWYLPMFYIPIDLADPLAIRSILIKYLPEKFHEASFLAALLRKLGL